MRLNGDGVNVQVLDWAIKIFPEAFTEKLLF